MSNAISWSPQPGPQHALVKCPAGEIFFGGARGGGKTSGVIGKLANDAIEYGEGLNAIMFRRTMGASDDAIEYSRLVYSQLGAEFKQNPPTWRFPNGARISFRYLDSVFDADAHQGKNLSTAWIDEAGQYPDPAPIDRLQGALRSPSGAPVQLILTANPGGPGQAWLRERYQLYPLPLRPRMITRSMNGIDVEAAVIPSRITDNKILLDRDPGYIDRLRLVGSAKLVDAWLEGDWSSVDGAFFSEWSEARHVIEPFPIPEDWVKLRAFDWGYAAPFSVQWFAVVADDMPEHRLRRGAMVLYREWFGESTPGKGLRLDAETIEAGILEREHEVIDYSVADPAIFASDGGPSIAERMPQMMWMPADNKRVSTLGHVGGWDQMRARLRDEALLVFSTCRDFIRLIPAMQHDLRRPEDLDTQSNDHQFDACRYALMSRPWQLDPNRPSIIDTPSRGSLGPRIHTPKNSTVRYQ